MKLTLELPDAEAAELCSGLGDLNRAAMESLVATGYRERILSLGQVRRLMGFDNRWDAEALLKKHRVFPAYDLEDLEEDRRTLESLNGISASSFTE